MRQPKAVGRTLGNARRAALTSLGAGLVVGAAAPLASAATVADAAQFALPAMAPVADSAPLGNTAISLSPTGALTNGALETSTAAVTGATSANWSRLGHFKLYPLAGTGVDPLSNVVDTSIGGIPVSTQPVTAMVSDGLPVSDLPVVGALFGAAQD